MASCVSDLPTAVSLARDQPKNSALRADRTQRRPALSLIRAGEYKANMIRCHAVPLRTCTVSFADASGVRHSVEVTAESTSSAHGAADSSLVRWRRGWPRRDTEEATAEAGAR